MPRPASAACRSSGYPVRTPVVDLVEIGAGGGSIAWVDSGGLLRVGPAERGRRSRPGLLPRAAASSRPSPTPTSCSAGSTPAYFLGGEIGLDVEGARRAIEERCAKPLGLSVVEAANGIVEIANAAMVNALHLISVQRGYDPRDFLLVGFGGAGPVHANALARDAEMPTLLIPRSPGIFSATGLLTTDLKRDASRTVMRRLDGLAAGRGRVRVPRARAAPGAASSSPKGVGARRDRVRPPDRHEVRRAELRADDPDARPLRRASGRRCSSASTPSTTAPTGSPPRPSRSSA